MGIQFSEHVTTNSTIMTTAWNGGAGFMMVGGTWGSATVTLQVGDGHQRWVTAGTSTTLTADGAGAFSWAAGLPIRVVITGATGTTNLDITIANAY